MQFPHPSPLLNFTDHNFFLPIIIAFMQLLTFCTVCSAHIGNSVCNRWNERVSVQKILKHYNTLAHKHADTEHTIQRRSNHCVVCLRSLYQFYYYIYSMIIISDSLHFSHSVALYCTFFRCALWVHWTNRHMQTPGECSLPCSHCVCTYGIVCMWNDVCSIAMLLLLAHLLLEVVMMKWTVKGRATLKRNLKQGEDGKGERNKYALHLSNSIAYKLH